jgi:hypothetical protein
MTELQKFLTVFNIIKEKGTSHTNLQGWKYRGIDAFITDGGMIRVLKLGDSVIQQNYDDSISYYGKASEQFLDILIKKL